MTHPLAASSAPSVLVDADPGLDDAIALLVLIAAEQSDEIVIDSVFAVGGNAPTAPRRLGNALQVLLAAGSPAPVLRGATVPSSRRALIADAAEFHGPDGLGGLARPTGPTPRRPR